MDYIETKSSVVKIGDVYNRYTILGIFKHLNTYPKYALVQCVCGSQPRYVKLGAIRSGEAGSCGCYHKEKVTKHGAWGKPLFIVWSRMMSRCYKPQDKSYKRYGKRGIKVCERWHDVNNFINDMQATYKSNLTIERINNNGNYELSNCKWATKKEQNRNYSRNVQITFNNKTLCLMEWSELLNLNYKTLYDRHKRGWSTERMLNTPTSKK
jgi:hypothetical protein